MIVADVPAPDHTDVNVWSVPLRVLAAKLATDASACMPLAELHVDVVDARIVLGHEEERVDAAFGHPSQVGGHVGVRRCSPLELGQHATDEACSPSARPRP